MTITRYATVEMTYKYQIVIDDDYVGRFNKEYGIALTYDEFVEIYKEPEGSLGSTEYGEFGSYGDLVQDWINEDLWDSYVDTIDSETTNYEDELTD